MTNDRARKKAARHRKAATGEPYVLARRRIGPNGGTDVQATDGPVATNAHQLHLGLVEEFKRRGWLAEVESAPVYGEWLSYAGPARVGVGRGFAFGDVDDSETEDPDNPEQYDLATPLDVHVSAPLDLRGGVGQIDTELAATGGPAAIVDEIGHLLGQTRAAGMGALRDDTPCAICGDRYPGHHLLAPVYDAPRVCPACVFDGDLMGETHVVYLAHQLDRLVSEDLSAPAGWAGVGTLLAAMAPDGFHAELEGAWRRGGSFFIPLPIWDGPGRWWTWVAASDGPLGLLAPGTSAAHLARTVVDVDPRARLRVEHEFRARTRTRLSEQLWAAAVTYVVSFDTQARERPGQREPWHVLESFDTTPEEWPVEGWMVGAAVDCVRKRFGAVLELTWDGDLGTDTDERPAMTAAFELADRCEDKGWGHVRVNDEEMGEGPGVSLDATCPANVHHLVVSWHEDDDGAARFVGAGYVEGPELGDAVRDLVSLDSAKAFVEDHSHG